MSNQAKNIGTADYGTKTVGGACAVIVTKTDKARQIIKATECGGVVIHEGDEVGFLLMGKHKDENVKALKIVLAALKDGGCVCAN